MVQQPYKTHSSTADTLDEQQPLGSIGDYSSSNNYDSISNTLASPYPGQKEEHRNLFQKLHSHNSSDTNHNSEEKKDMKDVHSDAHNDIQEKLMRKLREIKLKLKHEKEDGHSHANKKHSHRNGGKFSTSKTASDHTKLFGAHGAGKKKHAKEAHDHNDDKHNTRTEDASHQAKLFGKHRSGKKEEHTKAAHGHIGDRRSASTEKHAKKALGRHSREKNAKETLGRHSDKRTARTKDASNQTELFGKRNAGKDKHAKQVHGDGADERNSSTEDTSNHTLFAKRSPGKRKLARAANGHNSEKHNTSLDGALHTLSSSSGAKQSSKYTYQRKSDNAGEQATRQARSQATKVHNFKKVKDEPSTTGSFSTSQMTTTTTTSMMPTTSSAHKDGKSKKKKDEAASAHKDEKNKKQKDEAVEDDAKRKKTQKTTTLATKTKRITSTTSTTTITTTTTTTTTTLESLTTTASKRKVHNVNKKDSKASIGDLATLDEDGYQEVVKLCCPEQMTNFFKRVIWSEGLHICDEGGISGTVIWFDCADDNQSFEALVQKVHDATEGPCPYLRSGPTCIPMQPDCGSFPDASMPSCGGKKKKGDTPKEDSSNYVHLEEAGACSIDGPVEHERCHCKDRDESFCKSLCDADPDCKGYTRAPNNGCDMATTTACDQICNKINTGNVGELITPGRWAAGESKDNYGGCWKKI